MPELPEVEVCRRGLQPEVEGLVTRILVKSGDRVREGAPLVQINAAKQQATVTSTLPPGRNSPVSTVMSSPWAQDSPELVRLAAATR